MQAEAEARMTSEATTTQAREMCPTHKIAMDVESDCQACGGEGVCDDSDDYSDEPPLVTCWRCNGSGVSPWLDCSIVH